MIKRLFDLIASSLGLLLLSPLILILAVLVKLTSKGSAFYLQTRVGKDGVPFKMIKFRTMYTREEPGIPLTKKTDPRITPFGHILRESKLDELPQLINVLFGQMSIVGPRPEVPEFVAFYTPEQKLLLKVKPGLTSPASIYHRNEEVSGEDSEVFEYYRKVLISKKAAFDLPYVRNFTLIKDFKIILLTLVAVITNQSGYMRDKALKQRKTLIFISHLCICTFTYYLAYLVRFDGNIPAEYFVRFQKTLALSVLIKLVFLSLFGLSSGYWRYVSIKDVMAIIKAIGASTITFSLVDLFFLDSRFPSGVIILDAVLAFIFITGLRFSTRFMREAYYPLAPKDKEKVLIFGVGDRSDVLVRELLRNPDLGFEIFGFIDLDPNKVGLRIQGVRVKGTLESLPGILRENPITQIINTYPILDRQVTTQLAKIASRHNIKIKTLPSLSDVLLGKSALNKLQDLKYEDLLGREEVKLNTNLLKEVYQDKIVMITGAGGSIGSELVRQITHFKPKQLVLLDKDETLLYEIESELLEVDPLAPVISLIGDIRNPDKLKLFFEKYKPQVVLHAAAYKHVPLLEVHPQEAFENNCIGTLNLLEISSKSQVERFVMISTDKAVKPTNVMGATKALSEKILLETFADTCQMKCMAVRFGNVLGSRGSVIPLFKRQIERGGPIRITHENITRYFMSIPEASQLVLQAGAMGKGGEIFILKMGDPVRIKELAYQMIEYSGMIPEIDIPIEYTGLRPGEKMYEELLTAIENSTHSSHDKIFIVPNNHQPNPTLKEEVRSFGSQVLQNSNNTVRSFLQKHVPEYFPNNPID